MSRASESGGAPGRGGAGGFTLVEMMVTLFVAAVLLAIGVPAFNDVILGAKVSAITNDLYASAQLARSEAIKRNVPITLCPSTDHAACDDSGDWEVGWIVRDAATSEVLQVQDAAPEHFKVVQHGGTSDLSFRPIGIGATSACLTIYREDKTDGSDERVLRVNGTGSLNVTTGETPCT